MNDTILSSEERIRAFAAAVRSELSDLPEEDLEDLVGGLVGDLTDQAADTGGELELGDPAVYARELRTAAGLPDRTDAGRKPPLGTRIAADWAQTAAAIRSSRFGGWLIDLLVALRPVWWVLRGVGMYGVVALLLFPGDVRRLPLHQGLLLLGLVLLSVQWGRGQWLPRNGMRLIPALVAVPVLVALTALAVIVLQPQYVESEDYAPEGLLLDGDQVENLFVYDSDGELIDGAQIYTGSGIPLNLYGAGSGEQQYGWTQNGEQVTVPLTDLRGDPLWNVYPLKVAPFDEMTGQPEEDDAATPTPPFLRAPQRMPEPSPSPTPTPGASAGPTEPAPTPSPTGSPTP